MSKIICDVCGTSFSDTATQCPICGCVPSEDTRIMVATIISSKEDEERGPYTYVKGGRFSKANVKKRSSGKAVKNKEPKQVKEKKEKPAKKAKLFPNLTENRGLVIAVLALLLAIVAVVAYIAFRFFIPFGNNNKKPANTSVTQQQQQEKPNQTEDSQEPDDQVDENTENEDTQIEDPDVTVDESVACTDFTISVESIELKEAGETQQIVVTVTPENTTDSVVFESDDTAVATVDNDGNVVAVAAGNTEITITCGEIVKTVPVQCNIVVEEELPSPNTYGRELLETGGFRFNLSSGAIDEFSLRPGDAHTLRLTRDGQNVNVITKITPAETTHYTIEGNTITAKTEIAQTQTFYLKVFYGEAETEYITCKMIVFSN